MTMQTPETGSEPTRQPGIDPEWHTFISRLYDFRGGWGPISHAHVYYMMEELGTLVHSVPSGRVVVNYSHPNWVTSKGDVFVSEAEGKGSEVTFTLQVGRDDDPNRLIWRLTRDADRGYLAVKDLRST